MCNPFFSLFLFLKFILMVLSFTPFLRLLNAKCQSFPHNKCLLPQHIFLIMRRKVRYYEIKNMILQKLAILKCYSRQTCFLEKFKAWTSLHTISTKQNIQWIQNLQKWNVLFINYKIVFEKISLKIFLNKSPNQTENHFSSQIKMQSSNLLSITICMYS